MSTWAIQESDDEASIDEEKEVIFPEHLIPVEYMQMESQKFLYEGLRILSVAQPAPDWDTELHTLTMSEDRDNVRHKHLFLYNFLALALIRREKSDIAAVAFYQSARTIECYWAKNHPHPQRNEDTEMDQIKSSEVEVLMDIQHAEAIEKIVKRSAKEKVCLRKFLSEFFELLLKNCEGKINRRYSALRPLLEKTRYIIGDTVVRQSVIEDVCVLLEHLATTAPVQSSRLNIAEGLYSIGKIADASETFAGFC